MIREGRPGDLPALRAVQSTTLAEPWPDLLETAIDGPPLVLVCDRDGPVGYALAVVDAPVTYVAEVAVAPDRQGEGVGTELVMALFDRLRERGVERVRLTARTVDEGVHDFYERLGFEVVDRVHDHYESGDGLVFERSL
ncbi:GNAT family N-acetyltransferase [Halomicrobium urmianum]|uniref:GNAT family N-acetyltransferase n=1 Tax=Halomicrobium urmianum TaxID=1586233 RepID=UPI001CD9E228|nr:GNAT family N-acetyltransferase [Halomicrobium urmianum]